MFYELALAESLTMLRDLSIIGIDSHPCQVKLSLAPAAAAAAAVAAFLFRREFQVYLVT